MKLLVTGGAGFIGGNFVLRAVAAGDSVINLDKLTYAGNLDTLASLRGHARHVFVHGDIGDRRLVTRLLQEHAPEAIINFAAESHVDRSIDGPAAFVETNVVATLALLECVRDYWQALPGAARSAFRFLHISTDEVYGSLPLPADHDEGAMPKGGGSTPQATCERQHPRFTEATPYAPNSPYAASKAASDHLVRAFHHTYGLPTLTTNCSNNYGPYQFPEKLIPLAIHKALAGQPIPVYGDGKHVRDWLYVGDHCTAIRRVLEAGRVGETYNIGGTMERDNLTVVKTLCTLLDELAPHPSKIEHATRITFVKDRPGHDRRYAIDAGKIERELGWQPAESFETGIRKTVQWYLDNAPWVENVLNGKYRGERLGSSAASGVGP